MSLKESVHKIKHYLHEISRDLEKAHKGNKAASQRVRVNSIRLSKWFKHYRKESVAAEKAVKKASKKAKKATAKLRRKKR